MLAPGKGKKTNTENGAMESPAGWQQIRPSAILAATHQKFASLSRHSGAERDGFLCLARISLHKENQVPPISGSPLKWWRYDAAASSLTSQGERVEMHRRFKHEMWFDVLPASPEQEVWSAQRLALLQYEVAAFSGCKLSFCPTL